jgi:hypothetical protein
MPEPHSLETASAPAEAFLLELHRDRNWKTAAWAGLGDCGRWAGLIAAGKDESADRAIARRYPLSRKAHHILLSPGDINPGECGGFSSAVSGWENQALSSGAVPAGLITFSAHRSVYALG